MNRLAWAGARAPGRLACLHLVQTGHALGDVFVDDVRHLERAGVGAIAARAALFLFDDGQPIPLAERAGRAGRDAGRVGAVETAMVIEGPPQRIALAVNLLAEVNIGFTVGELVASLARHHAGLAPDAAIEIDGERISSCHVNCPAPV